VRLDWRFPDERRDRNERREPSSPSSIPVASAAPPPDPTPANAPMPTTSVETIVVPLVPEDPSGSGENH
jgi:hypothetical protein